MRGGHRAGLRFELTPYRNLINSEAAVSETVAQWIAETEARRATAATQARGRRPVMLSRERISELFHAAGNIADTLRNAEGGRRNQLYRALGLSMTYQPRQHKMVVEIAPDHHSVGENAVPERGAAIHQHALGNRRMELS
ncbi:hypothetical protein H1V43_20875 [Streptomyces sp. PSKA54]|uniref:Uncharacterized protein n=1 Tax=Streptomyces himalayensis subsp. aureolus TaxID=2758039 RepID=A0A7W2D360_9ACTN|nr:hypothetical protein [Streptomyces himalayensis subsp. aureolus]